MISALHAPSLCGQRRYFRRLQLLPWTAISACGNPAWFLVPLRPQPRALKTPDLCRLQVIFVLPQDWLGGHVATWLVMGKGWQPVAPALSREAMGPALRC